MRQFLDLAILMHPSNSMLTSSLPRSKIVPYLTVMTASVICSHAAPLAMDSFDYTAGIQLDGVGATEGGWTSPWTVVAGGGLRLDRDEQSLWFGNSRAFIKDCSSSIKSAGGGKLRNVHSLR